MEILCDICGLCTNRRPDEKIPSLRRSIPIQRLPLFQVEPARGAR